jgi:ABC-2 type transport system ATP-binding protein
MTPMFVSKLSDPSTDGACTGAVVPPSRGATHRSRRGTRAARAVPAWSADDGPAVVVRDLAKRYGETLAVDGVSFDVAAGEFFGLLGPNGAGKSTTLEMLEGLREPDRGYVRLLGRRPWPRCPQLLTRIGVQLQASAFFDRLTVREQIRTFASLYGAPFRRAEEMIDAVGLADHRDVRVEALSGGQVQRLALACTLVHDPEIVFLDEPTAMLDPQSRRNLRDLLGRLKATGRTVVLSTHHLEEAETLCDRVAIMDEGRLLQVGAPAALVRALDVPVSVSIPSAAMREAGARQLMGENDVADDDGVTLTIRTRSPEPVLAALGRAGALAGLRVAGATLEDMFLELTGREYRA